MIALAYTLAVVALFVGGVALVLTFAFDLPEDDEPMPPGMF
jgi:hypothetical protein